MRRSRGIAIAVVAALGAGCGGVSPGARPAPADHVTASPQPRRARRPDLSDRTRYVPVAGAMRKLGRHVDVPVVLPHDAGAGLPDLRGWVADSRSLDRRVSEGVRVGGVTLRKGRQILILSYGLAGFDGCGDRTTAEETEVPGQPALVKKAPEHLWSTILWPVTPRGSTGRYGISGTFRRSQIVRLAESMERGRLEAVNRVRGC